MGEITILNQQQVIHILDMKSVIDAVEKAYLYKSNQQAELYPLICKMYEHGGEFDIKSGECAGAGVFGLKLVCGFPKNLEIGLPRSNGIIVVYDFENGLIHGIVDGVYITKIRTGAAGGIGLKYLARKESETLMILGAGRMAIAQAAAALEVMEGIKRIIICNPRHPQKAKELAGNMEDMLEKDYIALYKGTPHYETMCKRADITYEAMENVENACKEADIIITVTSAREALIQSEWIKPGTHLSCIGADMPQKQEIDEKLIARAKLFADDVTQVITVGECKIAFNQGLIRKENITEIGKVIAKSAIGRTNDEEITVFDSTGIAIQDLLTAEAAIRIATEKGIGVKVDL